MAFAKIIVQVLTKGTNGGVESMVMNYCKLLAGEDFHFIFMIENESEIINRETVSQIHGELEFIPSYKNFFQYNKFFKTFFKKRKNIEIIHSNLSTMSFLPLRQAKKAGIPIRISEAHSTDSKEEVLRSILKHIFRHLTDHYLTNRFACSRLAAEFQYGKKKTESGKVFILPNAIDIDRFRFSQEKRETIRKELGIKATDYVIGHIGRYVKQKNHKFLLDIIAGLKDSSVKLVLIGMGELETKIKEQVISLGLEKQVIFKNPVFNIQDYYNAFDVFCLPSLYEGLPVVAVEAQTNGLPILLSDTITNECQLSKSCFFLNISQSEKWVEKLKTLKQKPPFSREINKEEFKSFDIKIQKSLLKDEYEKLLAQIEK